MASATESKSDLPPAFPEPKPIDLKVTVHSIEGFQFLTELGAHQLAVSILFPTHSADAMSPLAPPAESVPFEFSENYSFQFYPTTTINALLANPLEFFLYICTPDMKKQTQVARFVFPFDQLFFNDSYTSAIEGKVLPDGQAVLSPEGLKMNIECAWSTPLFEPEEQKNSLIATFNISSVNSPPLAMVNCSTQPNNPATHIFTYSLFTELPDNQVLIVEDGRFQSTAADGSDAFVNFNSTQKFFVTPEDLEKWKEAAENDQCISFFLRPELSALLQPLGITPDMYSALFGIAEVPLSHFAKPGRSHLQLTVPLLRDPEYQERQPGTVLLSPNGFPPEPVPEASKKKAANKKVSPSARTPANAKGRTTSTPTSKKPRALNAKEKKMLAQLQTVMKFDDDTDYFKQSTTQLKLEIALSRPIIPRPATPASTKTPEEIVKPLPKMHEQRLADATEEFCRQLEISIEKLRSSDMKGDAYKTLRNLIKESLKPSVVEIVRQVFLYKESEEESDEDSQKKSKALKKPPPEITGSFVSELRSFLIANLNKTINTKFDLAFPHESPFPPEMDVFHITNRIAEQSYHKTDDLEYLYQRRCELDPLNAAWPFEFALYYNDIKSPKALEYFSHAISIDYNFTAAILGFCSQLAKSGNREDCVVLLNMLDGRKPNDPTVTVCLSILYQLIESSKSDEFLAKISQMSANLPKSPNLIAAASLLEVHDTFLSEIMLTREQLQCQQSKELLVLLAKFTQQNGEYSRAQEYLKECLEANQEDLSLWKMLGEYQYAAGEFDKAHVSFERLLALAEQPDPEICLRLALINMMHTNYQKAYDLLMYTVQNTQIALSWTCLGVCCLRMEDYEEAECCLQQSNEMNKWDPTTWGYCAVLCAKLDRRIEGEQALILAAKLRLRDFRLIHEIINLYDEIAKGEETRACLELMKGIKIDECHKSLEPDGAENHVAGADNEKSAAEVSNDENKDEEEQLQDDVLVSDGGEEN